MRERLEYIYRRVNENPSMSEPELYEVLINSKFFRKLGYKKFGKDVRAQRVVPGKRKKADYVCRDEYHNAVFVLEAKRPSHRTLSDALSQLWNRYVVPLKAKYGVLTNGWKFVVYKRIGENPEQVLTVDLSKISQKRCDKLFRILKKPEYDSILYSKVEEYFSSVEKLSLKTELAKEDFFETFKLEEDSIFGSLLTSLVELFDFIYPKSKFLKGAYGFWQKSLARKPKKIPDSWKPFLKEKRDIFRFMFCLETAHALLARLIVAKACEDLDFPGISVSDFTLRKIHQVRGQIPLVAYPLVLISVISEMRDQLVYSVFEDDIFGWWRDGFTEFIQKSSSELLQESVDRRLEDFSETVAKVIFMLYKFDFGEVAGDPLGDLYQRYFDKETRKALGEFYTPVEVVNYILDAVGYENIGYERLLDPACGSGTFIVEALKRYLTEAKRKAKQHGWAYVLRELCDSPKIVGFDIHPFACLIARTRFMLELIPYFKKALEEEAPRIFYLQRIPVFRTDSLAIEMIPPEFQRQRQLAEAEEDIVFPVTLPMKIDSESSVSVDIILPSWRKILSQMLPLYNLGEYFCTLQAMFDAIKTQLREKSEYVPEEGLRGPLREYLRDKDFVLLANFFKPYADHILSEIKRIQSEFEDGRLVKSIEDAVLASVLKNYVQYDFVVGNPPYIRTRRLTDEENRRFRETYLTPTGAYDIYVPFMERAIMWLQNNGKFGFVTSNKYFVADYGERLRAFILNNCEIVQLVDLSFCPDVFDEQFIYPAITILTRTSRNIIRECKKVVNQFDYSVIVSVVMTNNLFLLEKLKVQLAKPIIKSSESGDLVVKEVPVKRLLKAPGYKFEVYSFGYDEIISKIKRGEKMTDKITTKDLAKVCHIRGGFMGFEYHAAGSCMTDELPKDTQEYLKIISPSHVRPYRIVWNKPTRLFRKIFYHPYIVYDPETISGSAWQFFKQKKIVVRGVAKKLTAAYDDEGYALLVNIYGITPNRQDLTPEYLLGLLNSEMFDFYHKTLFFLARIPEGSLRYPKSFYNTIPIKLPKTLEDKKLARQIIRKVETVLQQVNLRRLIVGFPETHLNEYRLTGAEFNEIKYTFSADHSELKPFLSGLSDRGFVVYPHEDEDPIWVDSKEKAQYLILALRNRKVKQNDIIKILVPIDNSIVTEILERVKKTVHEIKATPIDQLEEEINELVYQLYGLDEDDKSMIQGFLKKF